MLGHRIRKVRLELGLTQEELAEGYFSRSYISKLENGQVNPSVANLEVLAHRLGKEVSFFLQGDNESKHHIVLLALADVLVDLGEYDKASRLLSGQENTFELEISARAQYNSILAKIAYRRCSFEDAVSLADIACELYSRAKQMSVAWRFLFEFAHAALADENYDFSINMALKSADLIADSYHLGNERRLTNLLLGVLSYVTGREEVGVSYFERAFVQPSRSVELVRDMASKAFSAICAQNHNEAAMLSASAQRCLAVYTHNRLTAQSLVYASMHLLQLGRYSKAIRLLDEMLTMPMLDTEIKLNACKQVLQAAMLQKVEYQVIERIVLQFVIMHGDVGKLNDREIRESWLLISKAISQEVNKSEVEICRSFSARLIGQQRYEDAAKVLFFGAKVLFLNGDKVRAYQMLQHAYQLSGTQETVFSNRTIKIYNSNA